MAQYSQAEQRAWYVYDWANSAFATTVAALFLGPYLTTLAKNAADAEGFVHPLGIKLAAVSIWPYLVSASVACQVVLLPLFGAAADYGRMKREMLGAAAFVGALCTMAMFFLEGSNYLLGCVLFLIANSAFGAGNVIYNSFLPEIVPPEERDNASSRGWALGYAGGGVLLVLNLALYANAAKWGISEALAVRISLASAGIWWALFSLIPLSKLRNRGPAKHVPPGSNAVSEALRQLSGTVKEVLKLPQTLRFLMAYLIYNDAIQTVLALAAQFGQEELKLPVSSLTVGILLAQFVGVVGAVCFNSLAARLGNKKTVMITLAIYCLVLVYAYGFVSNQTEFYIMAGAVGAVMGGSQALSRSIYSFMIPKGHEAEYYSIYEVSDKGTSWMGPLFFGLALQFTGSYRVAIVSLVVFFIAGILILTKVNVRGAALEAGNEPPALA